MGVAARASDRARSCQLLVAAAGYGKSTALEPPADEPGTWYVDAERLAAMVDAEELPAATDPDGRPLHRLAVDDLDRLPPAAQRRLLLALRALPTSVTLVLAARRPPISTTPALLRRPVTDRGAADIALSLEATARVLREEHGVTDTETAEEVYRLTAGWPALVHLAGDALARRGSAVSGLEAALGEAGSPAADWLADQVIAPLPHVVRSVLELAVDVGPLTADLCREVAPHLPATADDPDRAASAFSWLERAGLLVVPTPDAVGSHDVRQVVPALAPTVARLRQGQDDVDQQVLRRRAAAWHARHGHPLAAALLHQQVGELRTAITLVERQGDAMLGAGGAGQVARLIRAVPAERRSDRLQLVLGDAQRMNGDAEAAARTFQPLVDRARSGDGPSAALAWRVAMVHYMRGEFRAALAACDPAAVTAADTPTDTLADTAADTLADTAADTLADTTTDTRADTAEVAPTGPVAGVDRVRLLATRTAVLQVLGEGAQARAAAEKALAAADDVADDGALAAAHIAAALTATGARRDHLLRNAQAAAERAQDVVQLARVLVNQADALLDEARYPQALQVAVRALHTAELGSPPGLRVTALYNVGEALLRLGSYQDAAFHFDRSHRLARRTGLHRAAAGLQGLADVHRALGHREAARMAYEEALELSLTMGEAQTVIPVLAGLVRLLLEGTPQDRDQARAYAEQALAMAPPELLPAARVARGWTALADGDPGTAREQADAAMAAARAGRSVPALAQSLELAAAVSADTRQARAHLQGARALWTAAGALPAADRMLVLLGRLPGADGGDRVSAVQAGRRLAGLGVRTVDGAPVLDSDGVSAAVQIRVLGGFEVLVAGRAVPLTAWRSRQARMLVKMLVARRGRPIPRAQICEALWPDDEPQRTAHRLSVLLSAVRTVLDSGRAWPPDHYVCADLAGIWVDLAHVTVDALDLLRDAGHAARLVRDGDVDAARELLTDVDTMYRGDAFDDEPYQEWAEAMREEVRTVWLRSLREAARLAREADDHDQAITLLVRLLAADPYDESAYRLLVTAQVDAGRHGEARRSFDRWAAAMRSIDAPPPDDAVLHRGPVQRAVRGVPSRLPDDEGRTGPRRPAL